MKTRVTELLGIKYPIVCGGMAWIGRAELAAAVSNAGGLGLITALTQPGPEALIKEIERTRGMTDKPFGVNLSFTPRPNKVPYTDYAEAIAASGVKIVETAGNNPEPFIPIFKKAGVKISAIEVLPSGGTHLVCLTGEGADEMRLRLKANIIPGKVKRFAFYPLRHT